MTETGAHGDKRKERTKRQWGWDVARWPATCLARGRSWVLSPEPQKGTTWAMKLIWAGVAQWFSGRVPTKQREGTERQRQGWRRERHTEAERDMARQRQRNTATERVTDWLCCP
jgi:hypothetical protein